MTEQEKREKVIKGLEHELQNRGKCGHYCRDGVETVSCEYDKYGLCIQHWGNDALALLKAQEPIEARLHLCESCAKEYPECDATVDGIEFGSGVGNDNIIGCTAYVNRWTSHPTDEQMNEVK